MTTTRNAFVVAVSIASLVTAAVLLLPVEARADLCTVFCPSGSSFECSGDVGSCDDGCCSEWNGSNVTVKCCAPL